MNPNPYGLVDLWTQGDAVIRGVAIALLLMSVVSWTVIVVLAWRAVRVRRAARGAVGFWHAHSFAEGLALLERHGRDSPFRHVAAEGHAAVDHHASSKDDLHGQISMAEWLTESLRGAIDESAERMQAGLAVLASVGSTAPFVGLFGTVWGIYHALASIGASGQASIDKVAGPVGEALIMTAFGLAVAIPAVLGYNALLRSNKRVINLLNRFARQLHAYFLTGSPMTGAASNVTPLRRREA
jgi:biopolymer transport protein ExbB